MEPDRVVNILGRIARIFHHVYIYSQYKSLRVHRSLSSVRYSIDSGHKNKGQYPHHLTLKETRMGLESIQTCFQSPTFWRMCNYIAVFFKALIHPRNFAHSIKRLTFTCPFCFFFQSLVFVFWRQARAYRASDTAPLRSRAIRQIKQLKKIATVIALLATTSDKARALLRPMPSRSKRKRSWPQWLWMAKRTCCGNGRKNSRNRKKKQDDGRYRPSNGTYRYFFFC